MKKQVHRFSTNQNKVSNSIHKDGQKYNFNEIRTIFGTILNFHFEEWNHLALNLITSLFFFAKIIVKIQVARLPYTGGPEYRTVLGRFDFEEFLIQNLLDVEGQEGTCFE